MKQTRQLLACLSYAACSVTMILANKGIASYRSSSNTGIQVLPIAFQNMCAVALIELMRTSGYVKFEWIDPKAARAVAPLAITFVIMLTTGFISLRYLSVPLVTVFKNVTNVMVVGGEWLFYDHSVSWATVSSILLMLVGALFASLHDLSFTWVGLFWISLNCLSTAGYVLAMKSVSRSVSLSRFTAVVFNNSLSCVLLVTLATTTGELQTFVGSFLGETPMDLSPTYVALNILSACVGFLLNFAQLWCVACTSATTYAIVGSLNKIPVAVLGSILFSADLTPEGVFFLVLNMAGGMLYSFASIFERGLEKTKSGTSLDTISSKRRPSFETTVSIRRASRDSDL